MLKFPEQKFSPLSVSACIGPCHAHDLQPPQPALDHRRFSRERLHTVQLLYPSHQQAQKKHEEPGQERTNFDIAVRARLQEAPEHPRADGAFLRVERAPEHAPRRRPLGEHEVLGRRAHKHECPAERRDRIHSNGELLHGEHRCGLEGGNSVNDMRGTERGEVGSRIDGRKAGELRELDGWCAHVSTRKRERKRNAQGPRVHASYIMSSSISQSLAECSHSGPDEDGASAKCIRSTRTLVRSRT